MALLGYRFIDHPSDVGMEVEGKTLVELFTNAAKGMLSLIAKPFPRDKMLTKELHINEQKLEEILHSFLTEILWFVIKERFFPLEISIFRLDSCSIDAKLLGIRLNENELIGEVKAITYHQLAIVKKARMWYTKVVFDV